MPKYPTHNAQMTALRRIEGQVRGLQRMIEDRRYCIDILTQLSSVTAALTKVQDNILEGHLNSCVVGALKQKSPKEKQKKIDEIITLLKRSRK